MATLSTTNPTIISNLPGLIILAGARPQNEKVIDIRIFGYKPPTHPCGLPPLVEGRALCATVDDREQFDGYISQDHHHPGIGEMRGRIKIMLAQKEIPKMRITEIANGSKYYELTYPSSEYIYITPAVAPGSLQTDFTNLFRFLSELYSVSYVSQLIDNSEQTDNTITKSEP